MRVGHAQCRARPLLGKGQSQRLAIGCGERELRVDEDGELHILFLWKRREDGAEHREHGRRVHRHHEVEPVGRRARRCRGREWLAWHATRHRLDASVRDGRRRFKLVRSRVGQHRPHVLHALELGGAVHVALGAHAARQAREEHLLPARGRGGRVDVVPLAAEAQALVAPRANGAGAAASAVEHAAQGRRDRGARAQRQRRQRGHLLQASASGRHGSHAVRQGRVGPEPRPGRRLRSPSTTRVQRGSSVEEDGVSGRVRIARR